MANLDQVISAFAADHLESQLDLGRRRGVSRYGSPASLEPDNPDRGQWRALQCAPRQERHIVNDLASRRFPAYCPTLWMRERHGRGALRETERPMFPGYCFVRCLPEHISVIRNANGIAGRQGVVLGMIGWLSEEAIDAVRLAEACHATRSGRKQLRWSFSPGDHVRIAQGAFAGFLAVIAGDVGDDGRISALVNVFGRSSSCRFDADDLERI